MTRYAMHPMENNFANWDREQKERRNNYWARLRRAWSDYENKDHGPYGEPNLNSFKYFMEQKYGIRVNMVGSNIDSSYQIMDDTKHTLFLLKYGSDR